MYNTDLGKEKSKLCHVYITKICDSELDMLCHEGGLFVCDISRTGHVMPRRWTHLHTHTLIMSCMIPCVSKCVCE